MFLNTELCSLSKIYNTVFLHYILVKLLVHLFKIFIIIIGHVHHLGIMYI